MQQKTVKKVLRVGDADAVVINISFPELGGRAGAYYTALCKRLMRYASTVLFGRAAKAVQGGKEPFAAVMSSSVTLQNRKTVSVYTSAFIYDGERREVLDVGRTWDLKRGVLLRTEDAFGTKLQSVAREVSSKTDYSPKRALALIKKHGFYITPEHVVCVLGKNKVFLPLDFLDGLLYK